MTSLSKRVEKSIWAVLKSEARLKKARDEHEIQLSVLRGRAHDEFDSRFGSAFAVDKIIDEVLGAEDEKRRQNIQRRQAWIDCAVRFQNEIGTRLTSTVGMMGFVFGAAAFFMCWHFTPICMPQQSSFDRQNSVQSDTYNPRDSHVLIDDPALMNDFAINFHPQYEINEVFIYENSVVCSRWTSEGTMNAHVFCEQVIYAYWFIFYVHDDLLVVMPKYRLDIRYSR